MSKAVVLLSGGLDSSTVLAYCVKALKLDVTALSFDYGQRHKRELQSAEAIAQYYGVPLYIAKIDLTQWGGSALTDSAIAVPSTMEEGIPVTYVPGRNTIFLSFALSLAEAKQITSIYLGINAVDYSGYPDCRPEYLRSFQALANLSSKAAINGNPPQLIAPLINKTKVEIVQMAQQLGLPIEKTWSCYQGEEKPCGVCDSCRIRDAAIASVFGN
jgi:7-cyano-7-deazaguanine synthase